MNLGTCRSTALDGWPNASPVPLANDHESSIRSWCGATATARQHGAAQDEYTHVKKKKVGVSNIAAYQSVIGATGANDTLDLGKDNDSENTYPRSSRKRQITFATISSFLSRGTRFVAPGRTLVRPACFSVAVAPKQSAKSIVEDCQDGAY